MRSVAVLGPGVTGWQNLPETSDDFEDAVLRACALVRAGDLRIGKVPKSKQKKLAAKKTVEEKTVAKKTAPKKSVKKPSTGRAR